MRFGIIAWLVLVVAAWALGRGDTRLALLGLVVAAGLALAGPLARSGRPAEVALDAVPALRRRVPRQLAWDAVRRELLRSRRLDLPFALVRIAGGDDERDAGRIATVVAARVREVDTVWADGVSVFALLPSIDRPLAEAFVERLRSTVPWEIPASGISIVSFPLDGLTGDALVAALDDLADGHGQAARNGHRTAPSGAWGHIRRPHRQEGAVGAGSRTGRFGGGVR